MPDERDDQIQRREPGGISRRSETARRGMNAAGYVAGLAKAQAESGLPSAVSTDGTYEFLLKWGTKGTGDGEFYQPHGIAVAPDGSAVYVADTNNHRIQVFEYED